MTPKIVVPVKTWVDESMWRKKSVAYSRRVITQTLSQSKSLAVDERGEENDFEPTWTYVPYKRPSKGNGSNQRRRHFSNWTVPKSINIPSDQLEWTFNRSSGSGGQNVNKVNTRAEIRFHLMSASWLPKEVRERLLQQRSGFVNKEGIMSLSSQEHRTQGRNREECLKKLEGFILDAYPRPKKRNIRKGRTAAGKRINSENKKRHSMKKENRRGKIDF